MTWQLLNGNCKMLENSRCSIQLNLIMGCFDSFLFLFFKCLLFDTSAQFIMLIDLTPPVSQNIH